MEPHRKLPPAKLNLNTARKIDPKKLSAIFKELFPVYPVPKVPAGFAERRKAALGKLGRLLSPRNKLLWPSQKVQETIYAVNQQHELRGRLRSMTPADREKFMQNKSFSTVNDWCHDKISDNAGILRRVGLTQKDVEYLLMI